MKAGAVRSLVRPVAGGCLLGMSEEDLKALRGRLTRADPDARPRRRESSSDPTPELSVLGETAGEKYVRHSSLPTHPCFEAGNPRARANSCETPLGTGADLTPFAPRLLPDRAAS